MPAGSWGGPPAAARGCWAGGRACAWSGSRSWGCGGGCSALGSVARSVRSRCGASSRATSVRAAARGSVRAWGSACSPAPASSGGFGLCGAAGATVSGTNGPDAVECREGADGGCAASPRSAAGAVATSGACGTPATSLVGGVSRMTGRRSLPAGASTTGEASSTGGAAGSTDEVAPAGSDGGATGVPFTATPRRRLSARFGRSSVGTAGASTAPRLGYSEPGARVTWESSIAMMPARSCPPLAAWVSSNSTSSTGGGTSAAGPEPAGSASSALLKATGTRAVAPATVGRSR